MRLGFERWNDDGSADFLDDIQRKHSDGLFVIRATLCLITSPFHLMHEAVHISHKLCGGVDETGDGIRIGRLTRQAPVSCGTAYQFISSNIS